jgi:hypothetical protein
VEEFMRVLIIIGLCFLIAGCSEGNYNRGYVISKAQMEPEAKTDEAEK